MMWVWVLLLFVLLARGYGNYTMQEMESVLNQMYENPKHRSGCATPIKCTYPHDGVMINATGNGSDASCCYDCDNCVGDRCYRGWQCCRDSGQGEATLVYDSLIYFAKFPQEYIKCDELFRYEKLQYNDGELFETGVTEDGGYIYDRVPVTYQMISSCPPQFNDSDMAALCESPAQLGSILNLMPILSKSKLQMYKNRHCVKCHNAEPSTGDRYLPLNLLFSAEALHYKYSFISMFETIYDVMNFSVPIQFHDKTSSFRIVLQASTSLLEFSENVNARLIPPCGIQTLKETECIDDPEYNRTLLQQACDIFYAPVMVKDLKTFGNPYIANNLACAFCSASRAVTGPFSPMDSGYHGPQPSICSSEVPPAPHIVMNIQPAFHELSAASQDIGNQRLIDVIRDQRDRAQCESGFFWDMALRKCRRILCPRRHYIYHGKCEPIYKETSRHTYYVKIKVTPKNSPVRMNKDLMNDQEQHLAATLGNNSGMHLCYKNVLAKVTSRNTFDYIVFELGLTPLSTTSYTTVLTRLKVIFDSSLQDSLTKSTSVFDGYRLEGGDILHNNQSLIRSTPSDSADGVVLSSITLKDTKWYILRTCGGLIDISKQDFCYRVRLEPDEYKIDYLQSAETIPRLNVIATGRMIYPDNYDIVFDGSARVCIEEYETQPEAELDSGQTRTKVTKSNIPDKNRGLDVNTVFVIIAGAIFAFVVIAAIICRRDAVVGWCRSSQVNG